MLLVKTNCEKNIPNEKICFSFSYFKRNSVRVGEFNNYYETKVGGINAVNDLFQTMGEMSRLNRTELYSNAYKKQFHLNNIKDNSQIDRIEKVLRDGYGFPDGLIDSFERSYTEFAFGDGKRAITATFYGSLFEFLFLDPNHLICSEFARDIKQKDKYNEKSGFVEWNMDDFESKEKVIMEYLDLLIEDYKDDKIETKEKFIEDYTEIKEGV